MFTRDHSCLNGLEGASAFDHDRSVKLNDVHSRLNETRVKSVIEATSTELLQELVCGSALKGDRICIGGGRHAMGGQQFCAGGLYIDTGKLNKVIEFDEQHGIVEVQAGIQWPELINELRRRQGGRAQRWSIIQKQTGADRLSLGGALSANVHGRGLTLKPIIDDIESFNIITPSGSEVTCSRSENVDLFKLAIGGYGLFGVISSVRLRLKKYSDLQRSVELAVVDEAVEKLEAHKKAGAAYGDFQFAIDHNSPDFLRTGIMSTYYPLSANHCLAGLREQVLLQERDWQRLLYLAHVDKTRAFDEYCKHYLTTQGQVYSSDTFQLATYLDDYHQKLDESLAAHDHGTEVICEFYVPRNQLANFMTVAGQSLRETHGNVIYGTVRLIEKDDESFMPWAKQSFACIVMNLHTHHSKEGVAATARSFRGLIDVAIRFGGSFYLTYHRFATKAQLDVCYPELSKFLERKKVYDPNEVFVSDWYLHMKNLMTQ